MLVFTICIYVYIGDSDFESLQPIPVNNRADIRFFAANDGKTLEFDDRVNLIFTPDIPNLTVSLEAEGEYIRETATINIIDNDSKCSNDADNNTRTTQNCGFSINVCVLSTGLEINFEESDYSTEEGSTMLSSLITLHFRNNQRPFTVTLCPVGVGRVEMEDLGSFINSGIITDSSRAIPGMCP